MGHFSSSQDNEVKPLPCDRDLLLRLLDCCDKSLSVAKELGDYLHKRINEEEDLREASVHCTPIEIVSRLSGWGIASQDFAHRFHDLADRLRECLTALEPFYDQATEVPNARWNELMGILTSSEPAESALALRREMSRICLTYMEYLVQLCDRIDQLKAAIEHSLDGENNCDPATGLDTEKSEEKREPDDYVELGPPASLTKYAALLGIDPRTLQKRIINEKIRGKQISKRRWRISIADLSSESDIPKQTLLNKLLDSTR